jgi:chromosome segregation ATPase
VAHGPDTPNEPASETPAPTAWRLGVLLRTQEIGAMLPRSFTLRAWFTNAIPTGGVRRRIAELEPTVEQDAGEHTRTTERLVSLEQQYAAARKEVNAGRELAEADRNARSRLENDVKASCALVATVQKRLTIIEAQLASSSQAADRDRQAAEQAQIEREAEWREERARLEAACQRIHERCANLETALARHQEEVAGQDEREATLRDEIDAARIRADDDPEQMLANAELDRLRTSLAEAETALQATQHDLARTTEQVAVLSKTQNEIVADRCRLDAALATARAELVSTSEAARRANEAAEKAWDECQSRWRDERVALEAACREAREKGSRLEVALGRHRDEMAAGKQREAELRAAVDAAGKPAGADPERAPSETDVGGPSASLAEAEAALAATRDELTNAHDQIAALSAMQDQAVAESRRLAADLAIAEERVADLERRLEQQTESGTSPERPIPF